MSSSENRRLTHKFSGWLVRARRLGGYAFWHGVGLMLPLALDRLIICPKLNEHLGKELFGSFIWVIGIMNLFGNIAANGFAIMLMRNLAHESPDSGRVMVRTSLLLSSLFTFLILIAATFGSYAVADETVRTNAAALYIPLGLFAAMRSLQLIALASLRVKRKFVWLFLLKLVETAVLACILCVAHNKSLLIIGAIYLFSVVLSLPVGFVGTRDLSGGKYWWNAGVAKWLMTGWVAGALMTVLGQTSVYASRIILGVLDGGAQVAVLYAGTSIGNLFVVPIGQLGSLSLSLLAGVKTFTLSGRRGRNYFAGACLLAVAIGLLSYWLGSIIIKIIYPQLAEVTLGFYGWIAVANGSACVTALMRPVAIRYGRLTRITLLVGITTVLQLGALAIMVPLAQARGAAISLAGSSTLAAILWLLYFIVLRRKAEEEQA